MTWGVSAVAWYCGASSWEGDRETRLVGQSTRATKSTAPSGAPGARVMVKLPSPVSASLEGEWAGWWGRGGERVMEQGREQGSVVCVAGSRGGQSAGRV